MVHASIENALMVANGLVTVRQRCTTEEVRSNGVLKNVRRSADSLTLVVDCKDIICMATITPHFPEDTLILLRHIFLGYYGQPMAIIEDLDFELGSTFPVVK